MLLQTLIYFVTKLHVLVCDKMLFLLSALSVTAKLRMQFPDPAWSHPFLQTAWPARGSTDNTTRATSQKGRQAQVPLMRRLHSCQAASPSLAPDSLETASYFPLESGFIQDSEKAADGITLHQ